MKLSRLFGAIFVMSLKGDLAFRTNLLFQFLLAVTTTGSALITVGIVYSRTEALGGWRAGEAIVLFGTFTIVSGMLFAFVEPNVLWFNQRITSGQLDDALLKPVSSLFLVSLGRHSPFGLIQSIVGLLVVTWGMRELGAAFDVVNGLAWLTLLVTSFVLTWAARVLIAMIALWVPGLTLDIVFGSFWQFGRYPVTIYRQPFRFALTWVVPLAFITTLPAQALTRGVAPVIVAASLGVAVAALLMVRGLWNLGLHRYTSATS